MGPRLLESVSRSGTVADRMRLAATEEEETVSSPGTVVPTTAVVRRVRELLNGTSDRRLALRLGLSRHLLVRAAAEQPLRAGSLLSLLAALNRLDHPTEGS